MHVSGPRPVILAVDDDHGIHEAYRLIFEDRYELLNATDGPQALKILQSRPIDLMLLDLKMPGMDGLAVLEHARRLRPELAVIIVSIVNTARDGWSARDLGAVGYLTKPWDPDHIEQKVREAFGGVVNHPTIPDAAAPRVIIISANLGFRAALTALLSLQCRVEGAANLAAAAEVVRVRPADLVIADVRSLADPDFSAVTAVRARVPHVPLLIVGSPDVPITLGTYEGAAVVVPAFVAGRVLHEAAALLATRAGLTTLRPPGQLVSRVIQHIVMNFPDLTVEELARAARVSPRHLCRIFSSEMSPLTPKDFLERVRIDAAKCLLKETTEKLEKIAKLVGFCDASHLTRVFRGHTGHTPSVYRLI